MDMDTIKQVNQNFELLSHALFELHEKFKGRHESLVIYREHNGLDVHFTWVFAHFSLKCQCLLPFKCVDESQIEGIKGMIECLIKDGILNHYQK